MKFARRVYLSFMGGFPVMVVYSCFNVVNAGSLTQLSPFMYEETFESGSRSSAPVVVQGKEIFKWSGAPANPSVSNENPKNGNYSFKFVFKGTPDGKDAWAEQRFKIPVGTSDLTVQYDLFIPINFYHRLQKTSENNKFLVFWSGPYGTYDSFNSVAFEYWPAGLKGGIDGASLLSHHLGPGLSDWGHKIPSTESIIRLEDRGQWVNYKFHIKLADKNKTNGQIMVWKNGNVLFNIDQLANYSPTGNYLDHGYLLGWANSGFSEETVFYLDNFKITLNDLNSTDSDSDQVTLVNFHNKPITSYDQAQDKSGVAEIQDKGKTLVLSGNGWKKINFSYNVTPNTVLAFDFSSDKEAEIEAIGLENDNRMSADKTFKIFGTQAGWGIADYDQYNGTGTQHFEIPIGLYLSGNYKYLTLLRDNDTSNPTGKSTFSNIRVFEKR